MRAKRGPLHCVYSVMKRPEELSRRGISNRVTGAVPHAQPSPPLSPSVPSAYIQLWIRTHTHIVYTAAVAHAKGGCFWRLVIGPLAPGARAEKYPHMWFGKGVDWRKGWCLLGLSIRAEGWTFNPDNSTYPPKSWRTAPHCESKCRPGWNNSFSSLTDSWL